MGIKYQLPPPPPPPGPQSSTNCQHGPTCGCHNVCFPLLPHPLLHQQHESSHNCRSPSLIITTPPALDILGFHVNIFPSPDTNLGQCVIPGGDEPRGSCLLGLQLHCQPAVTRSREGAVYVTAPKCVANGE